MKPCSILIILICSIIFGCSDHSAESVYQGANEKLIQQLEDSTKTGISADFVTSISSNTYDTAFALLRPELSKAWTKDQFIDDWKTVKDQLSSEWEPEVTGAYTGQTPNGPYTQTSYRLESDWRSTTSLTLISMKVDGKQAIVSVQIRVPEKNDPPAVVTAQVDAFVDAMIKEDYTAVQDLFSEESKQQYPPTMFAQINPMLGDTLISSKRSYNRLCANTIWYSTVTLSSSNDPASNIELILQVLSNDVKIAAFTLKARAQGF